MAIFGKVITLTLLAHAMALPKIQHRADGPSGFDFSQYFNNEKFQEYLKENPSALDYFNLQGQSTSNNAIQSDTMEDSQSQYQIPSYQVPNYQDWMKSCMSQSSFYPSQTAGASSSSSSSSSSSATSAGTKAENNAMPWDQYSNQFSQYYPSNANQFQSYADCQKKFQDAYSQYSNQYSNGYSPSNMQGGSFSPSNFSPSSGYFQPNNFFPSSGSSSGSSSSASSS